MTRRFLPLDSLRGIAAAAVVIMHTQYMAKWPWITAHWAVTLFFVLSGFVLAQPWAMGSMPRTPAFVVRRLCRLWPPVVVTVMASAALMAATGARSTVDSAVITHCVLLSVRGGNCYLDGVLWSLAYEVRISLVFPILMWVCIQFPLFAAVACACFGVGVEASALSHGWIILGELPVDNIVQEIVATLHYMTLFVIGIALSMNLDRLKKLSSHQASLLTVPALGLICIPSDTARGCGSALLIVAAIKSTGISKVLMCAPLPWLGRVSYSLYLIHGPVIAFTFNEIGSTNVRVAATVGIGASLCLAEIMHRLVEQQSIRFGRWLSGHVDQIVTIGDPKAAR